jgi:hypothetical protein
MFGGRSDGRMRPNASISLFHGAEKQNGQAKAWPSKLKMSPRYF